MDFITAEDLIEVCDTNQISIAEAMLRREIQILGGTREEIIKRMAHSYEIMKDSVKRSLEKPLQSMGGLIGGEAIKIQNRGLSKRPVCGTIVSKAIAYAMGVLEVNASMGLIVAAPTAGSSGVIPGTFLAIQEEFGFEDAQMIDALFNASAIGYLIMRNASVSGAEAGCQAEVGSASAMAASAISALHGASTIECLSAASIAITNLMGLVCDPIAGLVEAPCQKRNATGASNALISAEIALSGIPSIVPFDETIDAMYKVGQKMPSELRETALGGIAATKTACNLCASIF